MRIAATIIQNAVRLLGVILIVLGILFWTGHSFKLVPLHMRLGEAFCGLLCLAAIVGFIARLNPVLPIIAIFWAVLVVAFAFNMGALLPSPAHELIRVLHFLAGLIAIGLSESLTARIRRKAGAGARREQ
jgi:hypothetical protein